LNVSSVTVLGTTVVGEGLWHLKRVDVMQLSDRYIRAKKYFRKHGLIRSVSRVFTLAMHQMFFKRQIVFWLDLCSWTTDPRSCDESYSVAEICERVELPETFHARLEQEHAEELIDKNLRRRFEAGATLWCLTQSDVFLGYTWTIPCKTMRPYFFPLTARDVHIFDNYVFPAYRGNRLNSLLMGHVLEALKTAGFQRAYIETGEWNKAELRSLNRIGFIRLGCGKKSARQRKSVVTWWPSQGTVPRQASAEAPSKRRPDSAA
jgi:GNAT superfamily N-acetyltransferase